MNTINRRDFLKSLGKAAVAVYGLGPLGELYSQSLTANGRTLINLTLEGGPDFRHLFVPVPNSDKKSYGYKYWNNRVNTISRGSTTDSYTTWKSIFDKDYEQITLSGVTFGVLKGNTSLGKTYNGWLIDRIKEGKVAIVNNVYHSVTRDHPHSLLVLQSGIYETAVGSINQGGWGGRLIDELNGGSTSASNQYRLVSFSYQIRPFCNTLNKNRILSITNARGFGLKQSELSKDGKPQVGNSSRARALSAYYKALNDSGKFNSSVYQKFISQQQKLNQLTKNMQTRLPANPTYETAIKNLSSGTTKLKDQGFARQIQNLYDAFQATDLTGMRIASLTYGGWDSHKFQSTDIEPQMDDIFGKDKGFYALFNNRADLFDNCVIAIAGEFGRQLKANGDGGTDHGRGNSILLIGGKVNGGVYGEMFPVRESTEKSNGKSLFDDFNQDIEGRTAFHKVFSPVCDWVANSSGVGSRVFSTSLPKIITDVTGDSVNGIEKNVTLNLFV